MMLVAYIFCLRHFSYRLLHFREIAGSTTWSRTLGRPCIALQSLAAKAAATRAASLAAPESPEIAPSTDAQRSKLAHEVWWRDTRAPLYSEILSFCIRAEQENEPNPCKPLVTELTGRVNALGSPEVSAQFQSFISALKDQNQEKANIEHGALRGLIAEELWNLSRGFH